MVKSGYRYGRRRIEKIVAFVFAIVPVTWFLVSNQSLSHGVQMGLFLGVVATFITGVLDISASSETLLVMAALVAIGFKYGFAALGMGLVGYVLFTLLSFATLMLSNHLLFRAKGSESARSENAE